MQKPIKADICAPCGRECSGSELCENMKCAIGCADSKFEERVSDNDNFNGSIEVYQRKNELEKGDEAEELAEMENMIGIGLENVIGKKNKEDL